MRRDENRAGIVLCGGASRRMGFPKAQLKLGQRTFLECVVEAVAETCGKIVVVTAPGQEIPKLAHDILIVRDDVAHQGPLAAIARGVSRLPHGIRHVFVTGTDAPLLRPELIDALFQFCEGHDAAIATDGAMLQPLLAVYDAGDLRQRLTRLIAEGRKRAQELTVQANIRVATPEMLQPFDANLQSLRNVNMPADYVSLLKELHLPIPDDFEASGFDIR